MTTSYVLERQQELRDNKKLMREAERQAIAKMEEEQALRKAASDARIAAKLDRIANGGSAPVSVAVAAPAVEVEAKPKKASKKKQAKVEKDAVEEREEPKDDQLEHQDVEE
jgi:hypothetical protein